MAIPLHRAVQLGEPVLLQGPRSAGKTTLLRREFPGHTYIALDHAADRARARSSPADFLARLRGPAIVDDLHRAPELVHYLAAAARGPLILSSSRRLQLPVKTLELYSPTHAERQRRAPLALAMLGRFAPAAVPAATPAPLWPVLRSFVEHDVRDLEGVRDLDRFESFLLVAQSHSGQTLDQQAIAGKCGVSHRTVTRWLATLDACFLTLRLPPADMDFGRRIVRSPKLHFIESENFESRAISEIFRNAMHDGERPDLRYWRDSNGLEIPLVIQSDAGVLPVGIASTPTPSELAKLKRWMKLAQVSHAALIGETKTAARSGGVLRYAIDQL